jgi:predicted RNA-binding Zn-ribbon protein involved in translation (DUF1610 family)
MTTPTDNNPPDPPDPPTPPGPPAPRRFPCKQCGARLEFAPGGTGGTDALVCPYCSASNTIAAVEQAQELDFLATLKDLEEHAEHYQHLTVKCDACAAEIEAPKNVSSFPCPFCGSNIVATAITATHIKPNAVLPFRMPVEQARGMFKKWVASRWFAPNKLKRESFIDASFTGTYVPAWTYDCRAVTRYTGQRGDAYYVTVTINGRPTRQRRIRWTPAAGVVENRFDDVLVVASKTLNTEQLEQLDPWDTRDCVAYDDAYLAGFRAEVYQVGLREGFDAAQGKMRPIIEGTIRSDIGGDEQRISSMSPSYSNITFKHLLLPVWLSAYRFNHTVYRFMVNARTGEVVGERPYSAVKITLLVIMCTIVVLAIIWGLMLSQR